MDTVLKNDEYESIHIGEGTGSHYGIDELEGYKTITYPFEQYQIKIKLTPSNEFVGITEVKLNKDFLSHKQRIDTYSSHDVEEFYQE